MYITAEILYIIYLIYKNQYTASMLNHEKSVFCVVCHERTYYKSHTHTSLNMQRFDPGGWKVVLSDTCEIVISATRMT